MGPASRLKVREASQRRPCPFLADMCVPNHCVPYVSAICATCGPGFPSSMVAEVERLKLELDGRSLRSERGWGFTASVGNMTSRGGRWRRELRIATCGPVEWGRWRLERARMMGAELGTGFAGHGTESGWS